MKPQLSKTIAGGAAGTVVMTAMTLWVAPVMTGFPMDIAAMIGDMLGGSYMLGMAMHLMLGIIVFPLAYAFVAFDRLPGSPLVRGVLFGLVLWVMAAVIVMPMAGGGFLMSNIGGMMALVASAIGHIVYGGLLGAIAGGAEEAAAA
jgi:uncharacterized membrane protein YagU involved in acid resistance